MKTLPVILFAYAVSASAADGIPADVRDFIEQREACDHFREEIPDPEETGRMKEVQQQLEVLCRGTDRRLAALKSKYVERPDIQRRLKQFEPTIEPAPAAATTVTPVERP